MEYVKEIGSLFEVRWTLLLAATALTVSSWFYAYQAWKSQAGRKQIISLFVLSGSSLAVSLLGSVASFSSLLRAPLVLTSTPTNGAVVLSQSPDIDIVFTDPVSYDSLAVYTYPPMDVLVKKSGFLWNLLPFGTKLTLSPTATLPPGERLMVYLANMEGPLTKGYGGEQLFEFTVENPTVLSADPSDTSQNVPVNQVFTVNLTTPVYSKDEWSVRSTPSHPFALEQIGEATLRISPEEPLRQGVSYEITLDHTPVLTHRKDKSIVRQMATVEKLRTRFSTVKPAFIASFAPNGGEVNPRSNIVMVFDQPMNVETLLKFIKITPEISYKSQWIPRENTLVLSHDELKKDTQYSVTLVRGIATEKGGILESDTTFQFKTAGPLRLLTASPKDGDKRASTSSPVTLTFNQKVPDAIREYIQISPEIKGTFTVKDNEVEFLPNTNLVNETVYSVKIRAGAPAAYGLPSPSETSVTFMTLPNQTILAVPFFKQQSQFTCNIAAARMLLSYRGITVSEQDLIDKIGIGGKRGSGNPHVGYVDDFGTFWEAVLKGVTQYRGARLLTTGTLTELLTEIENGNPVMTWGQNGWSDPHDISWTSTDGTYIKAVNGMHSMVVRGYEGSKDNPTQLFISDPWRGEYTLDTKEFLKRWSYYNIAMAIE